MDVQLIMFRDDGTKRVFTLESGTTLIGRKEECTIRIPVASVSRRHAEMIVGADSVAVKDLGASNGTFRNNERVINSEKVNAGDLITIGPVVFTVRINGVPPDDKLVEIRSKAHDDRPPGAARVATSTNVVTSEEGADPISALEAYASSADQTAIDPEMDE